MYYPLYNNPFYYPTGAYMYNMCSYGCVESLNRNHTSNYNDISQVSYDNVNNVNNIANNNEQEINKNDFFSINGDRLEVFGISINIDDLIILIMLFFMFRENQIDYSIIIILALILFDQS